MRILVAANGPEIRRWVSVYPNHLGFLMTPNIGNSVAGFVETKLPWACDNAAFSHFDPNSFRRMLRSVRKLPGLLWIVCPDVVADPHATLRWFDEWYEEVSEAGPVGFVSQDRADETKIPWNRFACLFVGGTDDWKLSQRSADLCREAKNLGKYLHFGRVNSRRRLQACYDLKADSVDGRQWAAWSKTHLGWGLQFVANLDRQPVLWRK